MEVSIRRARESRLAPFSPSKLGLVGRVAASWGIAGGLVAAFVSSLHMAVGSISSSVGFLTTTLFYLTGATIGFMHGGILAYAGRPEDVSRAGALRRLALALLYEVPTLAVGWALAMLLAFSAMAVAADRPLTVGFAALGWIAALAVLWWTGMQTVDALRNLWRRVPGARSLLLVLALAFLALLPVFIVTRPAIWIVGARPTATAAVVMAAAATAWIGGPLGVLVLLAMRAWRRRGPDVPYERGV